MSIMHYVNRVKNVTAARNETKVGIEDEERKAKSTPKNKNKDFYYLFGKFRGNVIVKSLCKHTDYIIPYFLLSNVYKILEKNVVLLVVRSPCLNQPCALFCYSLRLCSISGTCTLEMFWRSNSFTVHFKRCWNNALGAGESAVRRC